MRDDFPHVTGPTLEPIRRGIRSLLAPLPSWLSEFLMFGFKQAWASLFAAIMLALMIGTKLIWQPDWLIGRYDAMFLAALAVQAGFLLLKLESLDEVKVIFIYHVTGTLMEIFKVRMGSWAYPEDSLFNVAGVPLFTGFMYGSVGSYMARAIRIFGMRFTNYPPFWITAALAATIYANFFTHHYMMDLRYLLMLATMAVFARVWIHYRPDTMTLRMPLVVAATLTAFFLWVAENIGTLTGTWIYPSQTSWHPVSLAKFGSWYLLIYVSFVLVTLVIKPQPPADPRPDRAPVQAD